MTCIQDYHQLLAPLDTEIARIGEMHAAALSCGPGCAHCCLAFSVLPIEAACLREAIAALPSASQKRLRRNLAEGDNRCPLLIDDLCSVYVNRPIICRTQGLPLAYVDTERQAIEVSACPLNFPDDYAFIPEKLLFMDPFNERLAELNRAWCHKQGLPPDQRIPLREIIGPFPPGA
ncbi:MAG: YkgJ family cysteine cluster protein [Deltaproteobacteria bacterium]|nr:YkgJ family cysteine cluster protein [Deltaproteobacteria bacterium]